MKQVQFISMIFIGTFRGACIQIEYCGFGGPCSAPGIGLNLLYAVFASWKKKKRKNNTYTVSWKTPVLKWLLLVAVHCLSRPMGSLHSSVLTRFLGQKLQVPRILGAAQYSAQQCSAVPARLAGQVCADCYARSAEKKEKQPIWRAEHSAICTISVSLS